MKPDVLRDRRQEVKEGKIGMAKMAVIIDPPSHKSYGETGREKNIVLESVEVFY